jgi:hypothetical protein
MNVIFLDFDGVLHDIDAPEIQYTGRGIDITGTRLFQRLPLLDALLARCPDVSIVISSSWQDHFSLPELRTFLGAAGKRVIGTTGRAGADHVRATNRYEQCRVAAEALGASNWLLLDDQPSIVWGRHVPTRDEIAHTVFCDPILGLTPMIVEHVARKLA